MIKVALIGYGSMGKAIESLSKENSLEIVNVYDENSPLKENSSFDFDVAIDFSTPDKVFSNIELLTRNKKNMVVGTTGWYDKTDIVKEMVEKYNTGFIWGSNFSVGMQMFFRIVAYASEYVNKFEEYDIMLHELHHKRKKDSPSGTAESLSEIMLKEIKRKTQKFTETSHNIIEPEQLHITSTRGGEIFGTHTVYIDSLADTLELTHRAKSRIGFASGAIKAAKFIYKKKGFYNFTEIFNNL